MGQVSCAFVLETPKRLLRNVPPIDTVMIATLFSQAPFIDAVARAYPNHFRFELRNRGTVTLWGLERRSSHHRRSLSFAPFGLYAYPTVSDGLGFSVRRIV